MTIHGVRGIDGTEFTGVGGILGGGGLADVLPNQVPGDSGGFDDLAEFGVSPGPGGSGSVPTMPTQPQGQAPQLQAPPGHQPPPPPQPRPLPQMVPPQPMGPSGPAHGFYDPRSPGQVVPLGPVAQPGGPGMMPPQYGGPPGYGAPMGQAGQQQGGRSWLPWLMVAGAAGLAVGGLYVLSRGARSED